MNTNNVVVVALKDSEAEDYPNICVAVVSFTCFMYFNAPKNTSQR